MEFCHILSEQVVPIMSSCIEFQHLSNVALANVLEGRPPAVLSAISVTRKTLLNFCELKPSGSDRVQHRYGFTQNAK